MRSRLVIGLMCTVWAAQGSAGSRSVGFPWRIRRLGLRQLGSTVTAEGDHGQRARVVPARCRLSQRQTAVADSIDADTVMRWNEYINDSQRIVANQARRERLVGKGNERAVRRGDPEAAGDNPEPATSLQAMRSTPPWRRSTTPVLCPSVSARSSVGGGNIRVIPFRYNAAAITVGFHQLATGTLPMPSAPARFAADIEAIKALDQQIWKQIDDETGPDPAAVRKLLGRQLRRRGESRQDLARDGLERKQAGDLKALHRSGGHSQAPDLDPVLAGVDDRPTRPSATSWAWWTRVQPPLRRRTTPRQRQVYNALHRQLVVLRNEVSPAPPNISSTIASIPREHRLLDPKFLFRHKLRRPAKGRTPAVGR